MVEAAGERQPGYAGEWIDQQAGGILRVAMAGSTAQTAYARLKGLLPTDAKVPYVKATARAVEALDLDLPMVLVSDHDIEAKDARDLFVLQGKTIYQRV